MLWTPDGFVGTKEKDVIPLPQHELVTLVAMSEMAQKYGLRIVCQSCDSGIQGKNSGHETAYLSVACNCREFRFTRG